MVEGVAGHAVGETVAMLHDEEFLQALVDGLPEAFPPGDLDDYVDEDGGVLLYIAVGDARRWLEDNVLLIERPGFTDEMLEQVVQALGKAAYHASIGDASGGDADLDRVVEAIDRDLPPPHAIVRAGTEEAMRRFWAIMELAAEDADGPRRTLLMIELYEGVGWTEDVIEYLGPRALEVMHAARIELAYSNGQIGRWTERPR